MPWVYLFLMVLTLIPSPSFCLEPADMARLKRAGVGDNVIRAMIEEKSVETCAFTVEEVIGLKAVGFTDEEVERIIRGGSFLKGQKVLIYGKETVPINAVSVKDILDLKEKSIGEDVIKAIILISSGTSANSERKEAWDLLKRMGIIVDIRSSDER